MWIAVPAAFAILLTVFVVMRTASVAPEALRGRGPLRFTQEAPAGTALVSGGVLSPDGRYVAFVAQDNRSGTHQLWIRALDAPEARALPGTDGAARPFWSPDSQRLGFFERQAAPCRTRRSAADRHRIDRLHHRGRRQLERGRRHPVRVRSGLYSVRPRAER
jgi:dipeptidyl aminopeptidase/acylaminoacyl peptidase